MTSHLQPRAHTFPMCANITLEVTSQVTSKPFPLDFNAMFEKMFCIILGIGDPRFQAVLLSKRT